MHRLWNRVPAPARLPIVLLLNILIVLALLVTAKPFWTVHTKIAFIVMACVNALLLKGVPSSSSRTSPVSSEGYFFTSEATETYTHERMPRSREKIRKVVAASSSHTEQSRGSAMHTQGHC